MTRMNLYLSIVPTQLYETVMIVVSGVRFPSSLFTHKVLIKGIEVIAQHYRWPRGVCICVSLKIIVGREYFFLLVG